MLSRFLKIVRHEMEQVSEWFHIRGDIDFNPPYQRKGNIWKERDRAFLIDTILNGYDIPKFYLADFGMRGSSIASSSAPYAIIDGKQRLGAIFDFAENRLPLSKDFVWHIDPTVRLAGRYYDDLFSISPAALDVFDQYRLHVMSVSTDDPEDINELFKRLNKGKSLTGAEVRNAATGRVAEMVRVVARHDFFQHSVRFSTIRMNDSNAAAKVLLFEYIGFPTSTKKRDLDAFYKVSVDDEMIESAGLKCLSHLDRMFSIFRQKDVLFANSGQVPAFFWFIRFLPDEVVSYVRPFLAHFYKTRLENRRYQTRNQLELVDPVIARYDVLDRNTNDAGSHRARINILFEYFSRFEALSQSDRRSVEAAHQEYLRSMHGRTKDDWALSVEHHGQTGLAFTEE